MLYNKVYPDYNSVILHIHIPKSGGTTFRENISKYFKDYQVSRINEPYINHYYYNRINSFIDLKRKNKIKEWLKQNFSIIRKIIQIRDSKKNFFDQSENKIYKDFTLLTANEKQDLRFISSHQERMSVPNILGKHFLKTLIIRDPVSRIQSYYFQAKKKNKIFKKPYMIAANKYDINDFIKYLFDERPYMVSNPNCICLSGTQDFLIAKKIIDNDFFLAAPLEKLDEFLKLICLKLFSKIIEFQKFNISNNNPKKILISDELIDRIIITNKSDIDLKKHIEFEFNNVLSEIDFDQT